MTVPTGHAHPGCVPCGHMHEPSRFFLLPLQWCNELDAKLQSAAQETAAAKEEAQRQQARAEDLFQELTDLQQRHETEVAALQHAHSQDPESEQIGANVLDLRVSDTNADEAAPAGAATLEASVEEAHRGAGAVPPEADDPAAVARASVEADLMALRLRVQELEGHLERR